MVTSAVGRGRRERADPYEGHIQFTTYRSRAGTVISVRADCTEDGCWWHREAVTRPIVAEQAGLHLGDHGIVIEVSTGAPAKRIGGTNSSAVPLDQLEEDRAWFTGGAQAVADLRRQRRAAGTSVLARHLTARR